MLTKHALGALRKGLLSKEIKKANSVMSVLNDFYLGCFNEFYTRWREGGKTMIDSGFFNKEIESYVLRGRNTSSILAKAAQSLGGAELTKRPSKNKGKKGGVGTAVELDFSDY